MPSLDGYLEIPVDYAQLSDRSFDISSIMAWRGKPVALFRVETLLPAQTAIIAQMNSEGQKQGAAGTTITDMLVLIGYYNYPGKTNFDAQTQDLFKYGGTMWVVFNVDDSIPGRREAYLQAKSRKA